MDVRISGQIKEDAIKEAFAKCGQCSSVSDIFFSDIGGGDEHGFRYAKDRINQLESKGINIHLSGYINSFGAYLVWHVFENNKNIQIINSDVVTLMFHRPYIICPLTISEVRVSNFHDHNLPSEDLTNLEKWQSILDEMFTDFCNFCSGDRRVADLERNKSKFFDDQNAYFDVPPGFFDRAKKSHN